MKSILCFILIFHSLHSFSFELRFDDGDYIQITTSQKTLIIDIPHGLSLLDSPRKLDLIEHLGQTHYRPGVRFILQGILKEQKIPPTYLVLDSRQDGFTSICDQIGRQGTARFLNEENEEVIKEVPVGESSTGCFGRCGPQCAGQLDRGTRYTQECLNHDTCHRSLGRQLGPCAEEFWKASYGFFFAPHCL